MTRKAHKRYLKKIVSRPMIKKSEMDLNNNPKNCTLNRPLPCPLVEKSCQGCWYDEKEVEKRKDLKNERQDIEDK
jgi:hypothetical protein